MKDELTRLKLRSPDTRADEQVEYTATLGIVRSEYQHGTVIKRFDLPYSLGDECIDRSARQTVDSYRKRCLGS